MIRTDSSYSVLLVPLSAQILTQLVGRTIKMRRLRGFALSLDGEVIGAVAMVREWWYWRLFAEVLPGLNRGAVALTALRATRELLAGAGRTVYARADSMVPRSKEVLRWLGFEERPLGFFRYRGAPRQ